MSLVETETRPAHTLAPKSLPGNHEPSPAPLRTLDPPVNAMSVAVDMAPGNEEPSFPQVLRDHRFAPSTPWSQRKGVFEQAVAVLLLVPALPAIGLLVAIVRLTSRGPGIYRQVRVGLNGREFMMYKIRSMTTDAEKNGAAWSQPGDPRVTRVGRVLRALHLDELPQLFNILRGEMSFVGPRPERPEFVEILMCEIPDYLDRLAVRPGITGLAQVNLPPDSDLDSVRRKQTLDLEYIRTASAWLDLRLCLVTGLRSLGVKLSFLHDALQVRRQVQLVGSQFEVAKPSVRAR